MRITFNHNVPNKTKKKNKLKIMINYPNEDPASEAVPDIHRKLLKWTRKNRLKNNTLRQIDYKVYNKLHIIGIVSAKVNPYMKKPWKKKPCHFYQKHC